MPTGHPHPPRTWHNVAVPQVSTHTNKFAQEALPVDASRTGEASPLGSTKALPVDASRTGEASPLGSTKDLPVDASRTGEASPLCSDQDPE